MIELEVKVVDNSLPRTIRSYEKAIGKMKNLKKEFQEWTAWYVKTMVPGMFQTRGKLVDNKWKPYSPSYIKALKRQGIPPSPVTLIRSGKMYNAATGGAGFFQKISGTDVTFGIKGDYFLAQHQGYPKRNLPSRPYMFDGKLGLPKRAWAEIVRIVTNAIVEPLDVKKLPKGVL